MKTLVIVESPHKAKTIQTYLGSDYVVRASLGHVRDLPQKELGVDIKNDFKPTYEVSETKVKTVKDLQSLAKSVDKVILAADPDREGEAIAWHLNYLLKRHCKNIERVTFQEITQRAILAEINRPRQVDENLFEAQQARRVLDRVVGYQLSPWLSNIMGNRLSAGRVQSVTLRIIKDRETEINNFKPEEYWKIYANLTSNISNIPFDAELIQKNGQKVTISNKETAEQILADLEGASYRVKEIVRKEKKKSPNPPFTTSVLQQEGAGKLGWESSKTMKVAQNLYEGVEVGDGQHGLITYMRTDSVRVSEDFQAETLNFIRDNFGPRYCPMEANIYKTKGEAQDAHEAIRPTNVHRTPDSIKQYLTEDQYLLYKLIWDRFVASQMESAIYDTVTANITAKDYSFRASGYSVRFDGFQVLYTESKDEDKETEDEGGTKLPSLDEGEMLKFLKITPKQKFTSPPPRFTEKTLIKELERLDIGRPSTYANILTTIKSRNYVEIKSKKYFTTPLGAEVVDVLVKYFAEIMEVKFTALMEQNLDEVALGKKDWVDLMNDFYSPFSSALEKATKEVKPMEKTENLSDIKCPICEKPMAVKKTAKGEFLGCTGYPECKVTLPNDPKFNTPMKKCEKCGKPMFLKEFKDGRTKKYFLGCIGYPECKHSIPCDKNGKVEDTETCDVQCPKCKSPMAVKQGKTGKFLGCTNYPECKQILPYGETRECPDCGRLMGVRTSQSGNKFWGCSGYPECKNILPYGETKECPDCKKPMVKRKGSKGDFWGCTGYPDCKHTEQA